MQKVADKYAAEMKANIERELEKVEKDFDAQLNGTGYFDINNLDVAMSNILNSNKRTTESLIGETTDKGLEKNLLKKKRQECKAVNAGYRNKGREQIRILLSDGHVTIVLPTLNLPFFGQAYKVV
jgi:hypothetical protein